MDYDSIANEVCKIVDWDNPEDSVSKHFKVKECLWLPQWKRLANVSDGLSDIIGANLILLCEVLDVVREFLGHPMVVHCMYRPKDYNSLVVGSPNSPHIVGRAVDFHVGSKNCDEVRGLLLPKLEEWKLRMENNPGANWIHLDDAPVIKERFFTP